MSFGISGEIGRLLGAKWKEMSDKEKKPYQDMADKDKTRATTEKDAYVSIIQQSRRCIKLTTAPECSSGKGKWRSSQEEEQESRVNSIATHSAFSLSSTNSLYSPIPPCQDSLSILLPTFFSCTLYCYSNLIAFPDWTLCISWIVSVCCVCLWYMYGWYLSLQPFI